MSTDAAPASSLDAVVRDAVRPLIEDGEVVTGWLVLAATRNHRDGGGVILVPCDNAMPRYLVKGILTDALDDVRQPCPGDHDDPGADDWDTRDL